MKKFLSIIVFLFMFIPNMAHADIDVLSYDRIYELWPILQQIQEDLRDVKNRVIQIEYAVKREEDDDVIRVFDEVEEVKDDVKYIKDKVDKLKTNSGGITITTG